MKPRCLSPSLGDRHHCVSAGAVNTDTGNTACTCSPGYHTWNGENGCTPCEAGSYCAGDTASQTPCGDDAWSAAGAASCSSRGAGYVLTGCSGTGENKTCSGRSQCSAGQYAGTGAMTCSNCSTGTWNNVAGDEQGSCESCDYKTTAPVGWPFGGWIEVKGSGGAAVEQCSFDIMSEDERECSCRVNWGTVAGTSTSICDGPTGWQDVVDDDKDVIKQDCSKCLEYCEELLNN